MWKRRRLLLLLKHLEGYIGSVAHNQGVGIWTDEVGVDSIRFQIFYEYHNKLRYFIQFAFRVNREFSQDEEIPKPKKKRFNLAEFNELLNVLEKEGLVKITKLAVHENIRITLEGEEYIKPAYFYTAILEKFKIWYVFFAGLPIGFVIGVIYEYIGK